MASGRQRLLSSEQKDGSKKSLSRAWSCGIDWGVFVRKHLFGPHRRAGVVKVPGVHCLQPGGCILMLLGQAKYYAYSLGMLLPLR